MEYPRLLWTISSSASAPSQSRVNLFSAYKGRGQRESSQDKEAASRGPAEHQGWAAGCQEGSQEKHIVPGLHSLPGASRVCGKQHVTGLAQMRGWAAQLGSWEVSSGAPKSDNIWQTSVSPEQWVHPERMIANGTMLGKPVNISALFRAFRLNRL